jgi:hypothetical protein
VCPAIAFRVGAKLEIHAAGVRKPCTEKRDFVTRITSLMTRLMDIGSMKFRFGRTTMFKDKPQFTVFGGAYVPEHHNEYSCREDRATIASDRDDSGAAWLVISSLLVGLTICAAEITLFAGRSSGLL